MNDRIAAIIVAAGSSTRYGRDKVLDEIGGKPILYFSLETFTACQAIEQMVVVAHSDQTDAVQCMAEPFSQIQVVAGGATRQESVARGLATIACADVVLIHDGARPLVTLDLIERTIAELRSGAVAVITAVPVVDTIKRQKEQGMETLDRSSLFRAQTPQGFTVEVLRNSMERAERDGLTFTDESALLEHYGTQIQLIAGSERNIKLTVPDDLVLIEALAGYPRMQLIPRTGFGYDVHRFEVGRPLILGGVSVPHSHGLQGHSDADVVLHALADALLGACSLGDIGMHFPPSDEQYRNISSLLLLISVKNLLHERGMDIVHCDVMVAAEQPKLAPFVPEMRERIAESLGVATDAVSIKATTNEGMGFIGRSEGIAAMATATVIPTR